MLVVTTPFVPVTNWGIGDSHQEARAPGRNKPFQFGMADSNKLVMTKNPLVAPTLMSEYGATICAPLPQSNWFVAVKDSNSVRRWRPDSGVNSLLAVTWMRRANS